MRLDFTKRARKDYDALEPRFQARVDKQLAFLLEDLRHPSLNAKKYVQRGRDVWQGRIDRDYRFYFLVEADVYVIIRIIPHPK
jgi:mRNA-degrading endonuclease RelE of RelBE toxin-antitoxin system